MDNIKVLEVPISKPKLTDSNPRQIKKGKFEALKKSLQSFPKMREIREIVVDEDFNVLGGHQRLRALKSLGEKKVVVKQVSGLTEEEKKEFIIKDNLSSGEWDSDILANEWEFEKITEWGLDVDIKSEREYYGDERERTFKSIGLSDFDSWKSEGEFGIPTLRGSNYVPNRLIGFNEAKTSTINDTGVHFFIDDYQFERVWKTPKRYAKMLSRFNCVLTPDFSLYTDMPKAMQIWNVFRARLIGQVFEDAGIEVIPTIMFSDSTSYGFCFDGLPEGGTFATSTVGVMRDEKSRELWLDGMKEAISRVHPKTLIMYGSKVEGFEPDFDCVYFENKRFGKE